MTTLNERIAQAMKDAGFETQTALSRAAGVPQPTISRICSRAHSVPDTTTLQKIANACSVSVQWLLDGTGAPLATSGNSATSDDEKPQDFVACAHTGLNVPEERAKFDVFMKPFEPRSQFRLRDDGTYASKAMRERFNGWLCARSRVAALPKTGVKVTDITQLQRDLARHAAGGNIDVAATCVQAQAVIEGLLSGLDAGQLA